MTRDRALHEVKPQPDAPPDIATDIRPPSPLARGGTERSKAKPPAVSSEDPDRGRSLPFTDKALRELPSPIRKAQVVYTDAKTPGLQYVLGRGGTGTFYASYYRGPKKKRDRLGEYGREMTLPEARKAHAAVKGRVAEGKATPADNRRVVKSGPTLKEATETYLRILKHKGRRPQAIAIVRYELLRNGQYHKSYVADWLDRPIRSITARECRERHELISEKNGTHQANRVLATLRAIWNCVAREAPEDEPWPANFTRSVNWHRGKKAGHRDRRQEPIPWAQLPNWRAAINCLTPMMRRYQLLVIFSGMRKSDAATVRREHINLGDVPVTRSIWDICEARFVERELPPKSMFRPMPKGGTEKEFFVPLSPAIVAILEEQLEANNALPRGDSGWLFPSYCRRSRDCDLCQDLGLGGHVFGAVMHMVKADAEVVKIPGPDGALISFRIPSPHRLRDTYLTAAQQVGVADAVAKVLANHEPESGRGDVTGGYRWQDLDFLRECQTRIDEFLLARMVPPTPAPARPTTAAPNLHLVA